MRIWPVLLLVLATACDARPAKVRPAAKAGTWYPADAKVLRKQIEGYFAKAPKLELGGPLVALVSPHAGYQFSGECAGAGYALLRGRTVRRVIVLAPSHYVAFRGGSIPDVEFYETPLGKIPLDRRACEAIRKSPLIGTVPQAHAREHSLELQLPFLQVALKEFTLIPIVLGQLNEENYSALAAVLREYLDASTVVVASSDFTHYGRMFGYTPFVKNIRDNIEKVDQGAIEHIRKLDGPAFRRYVARTGATICGRVPIGVMLEMLSPDCRGLLARYYLSGDREKDYRQSVSYASIVFAVGPGEISPAGRKTLLDIARRTLRATLGNKPLPKLDVRDQELLVQRGAFVTYKNQGRLRGCLGNFVSREPLWKLVQKLAVSSAREDHRFANHPITAKEEPEIDIQISILSPMRRIKDPLRFIVGIHGLYIRKGRARGTYLPQVATEQKWDKKTFITHLCQHKIGIRPDAWKDKDTEVYIYSAQVFGDGK